MEQDAGTGETLSRKREAGRKGAGPSRGAGPSFTSLAWRPRGWGQRGLGPAPEASQLGLWPFLEEFRGQYLILQNK